MLNVVSFLLLLSMHNCKGYLNKISILQKSSNFFHQKDDIKLFVINYNNYDNMTEIEVKFRLIARDIEENIQNSLEKKLH